FVYMAIGDPAATPWWYLVSAPLSLLVAVSVRRRLSREVDSALAARLQETLPTEKHSYVLYLRSFSIDAVLAGQDPVGGAHLLTSLTAFFRYRDAGQLDATLEGRTAGLFRRFGQVVAIGRPGEELPPTGFPRVHLDPGDPDAWKEPVSAAIAQARLVVIAGAIDEGTQSAEGTLWEYTEAVRVLEPSQVVLAAVCGREHYERFRDRAEEYFDVRAAELRRKGEEPPSAPVLPEWPEPRYPHRAKYDVPFHGVVCFGADWSAEFVHFDATAQDELTPYGRWRATVRTQVEPWMDERERMLPGTVVHPYELRWHVLLKSLLMLLAATFAFFVLQRWDGLPLPQRIAAVAAATYGAISARRMTDLGRQTREVAVAVGRATRPRAPQSSSDITFDVVESVLRWPGPRGLGLEVVWMHLDESGTPADPPAHAFITTQSRDRRDIPAIADHRGPGNTHVRHRAIRVTQRGWGVDTTKRFAGRLALHTGNALGASLCAAISFVWSWTASGMIDLVV
ncbi:MAG TPA: hypothetical protein VF821_22430, partial [Lentzea sp.]